MSVAAHTLLETYSVLTRLPAPCRLQPAQALQILTENLADAPTMSLASQDYWQLLHACATNQWAGGVVYDAILVAVAKANGISLILTHNDRDFLRLAEGQLQIRRPQ